MEFKPTFNTPKTEMGKKFDSNVKLTNTKYGLTLESVDNFLTEKQHSLKRRIFSLSKMEALVHTDPKLSQIYAEMAEDGQDKFGYHYNETIMNILFNEYVLNDVKYLQKYRMAIPKKKKRRDKSGINQLHKELNKEITRREKLEAKKNKEAIDETTGAASSGAYASPFAWSKNGIPAARKPMIPGGFIIAENYLPTSNDFDKFIQMLNESDNTNLENFQNVKPSGTLGNLYHDQVNINEKVIDGFESDPNIGIHSKSQDAERKKNIKFINNNSMRYANQDLDNFNDEDLEITRHDMSDSNSYFPSLNNKLLKDDGIVQSIKKDMSKNKPISESNANSGIDTNETYDNMIESIIEKHDDSICYDNEMSMANSMRGDFYDSADGGDSGNISEETNINEMRKINQRDYNFYVVNSISRKIVEGFEYKQDAIDRAIEWTENTDVKHKPYTKSFLLKNGINPDDNMSWGLDESLYEMVNEDRKLSSQVLLDRLSKENENNFNADVKDSSISDIVKSQDDIENKDDLVVGDSPYENGQKIEKEVIEKTGGEAFKNVGNSANLNKNEIPKRNITTPEQEFLDNAREGMHTWVYDTKPDERFEERMKNDMGDFYDIRQKSLKFKANAPMYNKDTQPVDDGVEVNQYNKRKSDFNSQDGVVDKALSESKNMSFSGRYANDLGKMTMITFKLNEAKKMAKIDDSYAKINFAGMGNKYLGDGITLNENVNNIMDNVSFYTRKGRVYYTVAEPKLISESAEHGNAQNIISEQKEKMFRLISYQPSNFIDTHKSSNTKEIKKMK